jgi:hypothetical protein
MIVEIINSADVESGGRLGEDRVGGAERDRRGLVKYFAADCNCLVTCRCKSQPKNQ